MIKEKPYKLLKQTAKSIDLLKYQLNIYTDDNTRLNTFLHSGTLKFTKLTDPNYAEQKGMIVRLPSAQEIVEEVS